MGGATGHGGVGQLVLVLTQWDLARGPTMSTRAVAVGDGGCGGDVRHLER